MGKEDAKKRKTDEAEKERNEDVKDKGEKRGADDREVAGEKKARRPRDEEGAAASSGMSDEERKRGLEEANESEAQRRRLEEARGEKRERGGSADDEDTAAKYLAIDELWQTDEAGDKIETVKAVRAFGFDVNQVEETVGPHGEEDEVEPRELCPEKVREGRAEELDYMKKIDMFEFVKTEECWERLGHGPVSTKWVDVAKVDDQGREVVRCRLVGRDFKPKGERDREDLFAAMPPLEAKKLLFRMMATERNRDDDVGGGASFKLMFIDVRKAHLNAVCTEDAYVELPVEMGMGGYCGKLKRWLYGMRKAAQGWEDNYLAIMSRSSLTTASNRASRRQQYSIVK